MKYEIVKHIEAKNIEEAIKKEKTAEIKLVECIDLESLIPFKPGYGRK